MSEVFWTKVKPPEALAKVGGTKALEIMCGSMPRDGEWYKLNFSFSLTTSNAGQAVQKCRALYPRAQFTVSKEDDGKYVYVRFEEEQ